jgi:hypothetical protein
MTQQNYAGIDKVQPAQQRLPFIEPGSYVLEVQNVKSITTRVGVPFLIAEFRVKERTTPTGNEPGTGCKIMFKKTADPYLKNAKNLFAAIGGVEEGKVTQQLAESIDSEQSAGVGAVVRCDATSKKTRTGGDWTECHFAAFKK